jgi:hypothetical protein
MIFKVALLLLVAAASPPGIRANGRGGSRLDYCQLSKSHTMCKYTVRIPRLVSNLDPGGELCFFPVAFRHMNDVPAPRRHLVDVFCLFRKKQIASLLRLPSDLYYVLRTNNNVVYLYLNLLTIRTFAY